VHKLKVEMFPMTRRERQIADRAYFANRIEVLMKLKRSRTKWAKVKEAVVEQLPLFPSG
jgi:hypothetical protein